MSQKSQEYVRAQSVAALERVIEIVGTRTKLGAVLGIAESVVGNWLSRTKYGVAPTYVLPLEHLSGGMVSRYQLRCDIYPDGEEYFTRLNILMIEILDDLKIKSKTDFTRHILKALPKIIDVIYKDQIRGGENWAPEILTCTMHPDAIQYAIFQPEYYEFPSHYDARLRRAFFAMQTDLLDTLKTLLSNSGKHSHE